MRTNFKILVHASALKDFPHQEKDHLNHQKHITAMTMLPVYNVHTHNSGHTVMWAHINSGHAHTHNTEMSHLKHKHDE